MMKLPRIDYHIHTVYCGHAAPEMTVRAVAEKAVEAGIESIALTEHAFYNQMGKANMEQIRREIKALDMEINVFLGMEIDPDYKRPGHLVFEEFERKELKPVLVGTHTFPVIEKGWYEKIHLTAEEKRKIYAAWFENMEKIMENPLVDVLAHPGRLLSQNGIIEEFSGYVLKDFELLFEAARKNHVAVELNENIFNVLHTEKLKKSYPYLLQLALEKGLKISIGSDAHNLESIGKYNNVFYFSQFLNLSAGNFYHI